MARRIVERVRAGLARRAAQGNPLGRPRQTISDGDLARTVGTVDAQGGCAPQRLPCGGASGTGGLKNPENRPAGLRLNSALLDDDLLYAWSL